MGADGSDVSDGITDKFSDLIFVLFDQTLAEGGNCKIPHFCEKT